MSYVIQNFFFNNKYLNTTPRLKTLIIFNNIHNVFIFLKLNNFFFYFNNWHWRTVFFSQMFKNFFNDNIYNFFWLTNFKINSNYTNSITVSCFYWIFKLFNFYTNKNLITKNDINWNYDYINNLYFYPIKVADPYINFKIFKNFFFYTILKASRLWNDGELQINFHKNFLFNTTELYFFIFYSGPFFRIYTF